MKHSEASGYQSERVRPGALQGYHCSRLNKKNCVKSSKQHGRLQKKNVTLLLHMTSLTYLPHLDRAVTYSPIHGNNVHNQ